jgi:hypothetical protein
LDHRTLWPFVAQLPCAAREQTGDVAFHYWAALPTGTGQLYLMWSTVAV